MSSLVFITTQSRREALELARLLTAQKLCAGINLVPGAYSVYWWQGEVREKEECLLFAQVSTENLENFIAETKRVHSYHTPCIVCIPVSGGFQPFLEWIEKNGQELA